MISFDKYLELLEKETSKILEPELVTMQGGKSAIRAIRVTVEKLVETKDSKLALDILNTISYFYIDEISFEILKLTFPDDVINIDNAVQKLESYSLVQKHDNIIRIHSLIQKSMISQHKENDNRYFLKCLNMFQNQLNVEEIKYIHESFGKEWYKHLIYFISTNTNSTGIYSLLYENFCPIFDTLRTKGRLNDLINFMESLLIMFTEKNGPSHEKTMETMVGLARCHEEVFQYDKAIELNQKVLGRVTKLYGKNSQETLRVMHNIGTCFSKKGKVDEATEMNKKILHGFTKLYGKNSSETLLTMYNLALCFDEKGKVDKAIEMMKKVLDGYTKLYERNNQLTLRTMHALAMFFQRKGKIDQAIEMLREVLCEQTKLHGKTNQETINTMNDLALCFAKTGRIEEAKTHYEEALSLCQSPFEVNHWLTNLTQKNLSQLENDEESLKEVEKRNCVVM